MDIREKKGKYLPSEIIFNILSRLPVQATIRCKCVCKSWCALVETKEFAKSHLSNSVPGLAIHELDFKSWSKISFYGFKDELDLQHHNLHYDAVIHFDLFILDGRLIRGSVNGLLFLQDIDIRICRLFICNPVTREYIDIDSPPKFSYGYNYYTTYGFGVSRMSGLYKVVRIFQYCKDDNQLDWKLEFYVYTLQIGSWKHLALGGPVAVEYGHCFTGVFLNGNLHWMVFRQHNVPLISCFDLETELLSTPFSLSHLRHGKYGAGLFALEDCLCICDISDVYKIEIWLMKEYGVEKSWTKEFVITKYPKKSCEFVYPIKIFKDGDFLMAWEDSHLYYYSKKTKTTRKIDIFEPQFSMHAFLYVPSFVSLKSLEMKNVLSL